MTAKESPLDALNARQHKFVLNLFSGMSQTEAYIQAGYEPCSREVAESSASQLVSIPLVSNALAELRHSVKASAVAPLARRMEILTEIAEHPIEMPVTAGHKLAAVAEINKVEGSYAPSKHLIAQKVQFEVVHTSRDK